MPAWSNPKQPYIWPLLLLIVANGSIIADISPGLRYATGLVLLSFLPGWVWLQAFFDKPSDLAERVTIAIGLSLALTILGAMFAVYLPGPLSLSQLLVIVNTIVMTGLVALWWPKRSLTPKLFLSSHSIFILLALLLMAAALRLPNLGYAEFHEDEAEALMLGVRLFQGEDYALFLHRKGPAQMLIPVTFWLFSGRITEVLARFPFALSSMLSVMTLFFIGRRWFSWQAGLIAGLLWAINGYAIGFGRMVQYQALIFFLGPLAIYCLYLAWKYQQSRFQILGAIFLATSLLAHFDALLLLPAAGYLGWLTISRRAEEQTSRAGKGYSSLPSRLLMSALPLILFLILLASFYLPYMLDPEFKNTIDYLAESRIKPGLLYNNLDLLRRLDRDYSSHFYLPALALGLIAHIIWQSTKLQRRRRWVIAGLVLLLVSTFWLPHIWRIEQLSLAILPWLLCGIVCFWFSPTVEIKTAWVMFGTALIGYLFLVDDPRTHLYMIYPGAVLLAGAGWATIIIMHPMGRHIVVGAGVLVFGAIVIYTAAIFLQTESAFNRLRARWDDSIWETVYDDIPTAREYFGYPKREGWKAIGALRSQGKFPGDFRSVNEDFIIPIWYNYGQARSCYNTSAHFFVRSGETDIPTTDVSYSEVGQIWREGEARLRIFSAGIATQAAPTIHTVEELEEIFDQFATPGYFARQDEPSQFVRIQFGSVIDFVGYDLPTTVVAPGDILYVNLYWQALRNPGGNYRAFVHLTDGATLWAQQDDDPICRLPTSIWRAGQRGLGQFRLLISPEIPPGRYPLVIGLYQADTLERLKITGGTGQLGDDFLWLADVEVVKSN